MVTERNPFVPMPRFNWTVILGAGALAVLVLGFGESTLRLATIESLIQTVLILSVVLLAGYVGQVTLAELTFAGFAAFMLARFAGEMDLPFPLSPILAIVITTVVGTLVSLPAVRIRGIQLAIVTVAAATAIEEVLFRSPSFTGVGGMARVPKPSFLGLNIGILPDGDGEYPNRVFGFFVLLVAIGSAMLVVNVRRSAVGRRMLAVRANERAAAAGGIHVPRTSFLGAALGSFLASVAGVMMGYKFVDFSNAGFEASRGLAVVALAYIGGIATVGGAFVAGILAPAGILFTVMGANSTDLQLLLSGFGLIIVAIKFPGGIASAREPMRRAMQRAKATATPSSLAQGGSRRRHRPVDGTRADGRRARCHETPLELEHRNPTPSPRQRAEGSASDEAQSRQTTERSHERRPFCGLEENRRADERDHLMDLAPLDDDVVDEAVVLGLLGREPAVAVGVDDDLLDRLAGVVGDPLGQQPLGVGHLLGLDGDVGRLTPKAAEGLVHHDPGVGQRVPLARGAGAQQELAHRGGEAHADGGDVAATGTASCRRWPCRPSPTRPAS